MLSSANADVVERQIAVARMRALFMVFLRFFEMRGGQR
jgi:hypothetical protein